MCSIKEIFLISQCEATTIEIARRNGISLYLQFADDLQFRSFLSLLDGYHRLSINWFFNISQLTIPPSFEFRRTNRCHGPVGTEFAVKKLQDKGHDKMGTYIVRESSTAFDVFELDVILEDGIHNLTVTRKSELYFVKGYSVSFASLLDITKKLNVSNPNGQGSPLTYCLPPSETAQDPPCLLLCQAIKKSKPKEDSNLSFPRIFKSDEINLKDAVLLKSEGNFNVYLIDMLHQNLLIKCYKNEHNSYAFLEKLNYWYHIQSEFVAKTMGICLHSPLAYIREYFPMGKLDNFLKINRKSIKVVDLVECVTYLAHGLWYLYDNKIFHGRIRCNTILVTEYSPHTFKVKFCDPLNDMNENYERAWISPEFKSALLFNNPPSVDVWAFGTTLWEIFSYGSKPLSTNVYNLVQPFACPILVWKLITDCWISDANFRIIPQAIVRDLNQVFHVFYTQKQHDSPKYAMPCLNSQQAKSKGLFGLLSFGKNEESDHESEFNFDDIDEEATNGNEPWILDANSLKFVTGKDNRVQILGKGNYGQVIKAKFSSALDNDEIYVAVKRLNKSFNQEVGLKRVNIAKDMEREFKIMTQLSHENIVKIVGVIKCK